LELKVLVVVVVFVFFVRLDAAATLISKDVFL
jgi:hypothetical protein